MNNNTINLFEETTKILENNEYFYTNVLPEIASMVETFRPTDENQLEFDFVKDYE